MLKTTHLAFIELRILFRQLVHDARHDNPLGVIGYTPAAFGQEYNAVYLRDFTYMAEAGGEFIPREHMRGIIDLFVSRISPEGICPERISNAGEIHYMCHGNGYVTDSPLFLVKLVAAYMTRTDDRAFALEIYPVLCRVLESVPRQDSTGLVWIDPGSPHTAYGFTDTIAITGQHLFCSLLLYEESLIMARFAGDLKKDDDVARHIKVAQRIRDNLRALWSDEHDLFFAGSVDGHRADIWGSAYACVIGAIEPEQRKRIADSLWRKKERFMWRGQVRHLLLPEFWQKLTLEISMTAPGRFQNGAFWGTAAGWVAEAFEAREPGSGLEMLCGLVQDFKDHGVWECVGPDGYTRVPNNVSSVGLPYLSFKKLLALA